MGIVRSQTDSKVYLEPIEHVYIENSTGKKFTSVTKVLSSIEPHFNGDAIAEAIVKQPDSRKQEKYIGMNKSQILDMWQELNDTANEYGNKVHETIENFLLKDKLYFPDDPLEKKVIKAYVDLAIDEGQTLWPERIMYSAEHQLAGTSDLIIDVDQVYFDVGDYKGLPINTPVFTDSGWKTMGTLSLNDKVYDKDGEETKIKAISNIKNKDCYEIKFDTGETIVSDFEHRWLISFCREKKYKDVVMTTFELFQYLNKLPEGKKRYSWKIPKIRCAEPLKIKEVELPIDPYVFGVWLGDGNSADGKITNMNVGVWDEIKRRGYSIGDDISGGGAGLATTRTIFGLTKELNKLGLLTNKHLPDIFLNSSFDQRLAILRGLMDSDGHYNKTRERFVMATTKEWQVDATKMLASSLGFKVTTISCKKYCNGKTINGFDVCFTSNNLNPFLIRNNEIELKIKSNSFNTHRNISEIKKVESTPTICIEVESETHTFLFGKSFIVTHNTNREFNFYNKFGFKTLLKPFDHLQDCQYSIYTLQLSTYAYMYELETGRKCRQIYILYWSRESETFSKIPVMYLRKEAKQLLDLHRFNLLNN